MRKAGSVSEAIKGVHDPFRREESGTVTAVSHVQGTPRERRFGVFLAAEAGLWLSLYAVYFVIRGETISGAQQAMANARSVVDIERALGLAHERVLQNAIGTADYLGTFL